MLQGRYDPLDQMFVMQSFDARTSTFAGYHEGKKEVYLGACWVGTPMTGLGEGQLLSIQSILSSPFPKDTIIQFGLLSTPDIEDAPLDYLYKKKDDQNALTRELVNRQYDLIMAGRDKPIIETAGVHLNRKRLIVTMKCKFDEALVGTIVEFNEIANKFESSLRANAMDIVRAGAAEFLAVARLITHLYDPIDTRYDDSLALNEQVFYAGDEVLIHKDYIEFNTGKFKENNFFANALSPKFLPKEFTIGLMNYAIGDPKGVSNQLRQPYLMVMTMNYPEQVAKKADVTRKAQWINHQLMGGGMARFMPSLVLKKEGFDVLQEEIERNSAVLVEATFTLWIFGKTLADIQTQNDDVRTYWSSLGFEMRGEKYILDVLFYQTLPLNTTHKGSVGVFRHHTLTASQAAQFLPIVSEWRGSYEPTILLTTRRGEVGGFDIFKSASNYNAVLVAASGSGKSFVTQRFVTDYLAEGAKVWVIDSGNSYKKLCAAQGGTFMEFTPISNVCLNPFTSFLPERGGSGKSIDEEMEMISSLIERMAAQRDPLDDLDMETLKKSIRQTFIEHQGYTTIQNICDWLTAQTNDTRARNLALRLDSFAYGQYSRFFNDFSNVNMDSDFVVLELDGLKNQKQLQQVVLLQLITQVTNEMYLTSGRRKILIIDEAWALMDDPIMSRAMEEAGRKARKYDSAIVVVTQGIGDLYKSKSGQSLIENSAWQLVLQQKVEAIDSVRNDGHLSVDGYAYEMMKTLTTVPGSYSEMMIIGNGGAGVFRLTVDKFTQIMYSTSGRERTQILADIDAGVNVIDSINNYMIGEESFETFGALKRLIHQTVASGRNKREIMKMIKKAAEEVDAIT